MARIREAQIGEDGDIRIVRRGGGWRVVLALALLAGGVWLFDATYGARGAQGGYQMSETVSN